MTNQQRKECCFKCYGRMGTTAGGGVYCVESNCPCHQEPTLPTFKEEAERVARNIVYQIGDVLYEALPPDVAHKYFVKARQNTNDRAIDFATKLILSQITTAHALGRKEMGEEIFQECLELEEMNGSDFSLSTIQQFTHQKLNEKI